MGLSVIRRNTTWSYVSLRLENLARSLESPGALLCGLPPNPTLALPGGLPPNPTLAPPGGLPPNPTLAPPAT